jgi:hypothetical protein
MALSRRAALLLAGVCGVSPLVYRAQQRAVPDPRVNQDTMVLTVRETSLPQQIELSWFGTRVGESYVVEIYQL